MSKNINKEQPVTNKPITFEEAWSGQYTVGELKAEIEKRGICPEWEEKTSEKLRKYRRSMEQHKLLYSTRALLIQTQHEKKSVFPKSRIRIALS